MPLSGRPRFGITAAQTGKFSWSARADATVVGGDGAAGAGLGAGLGEGLSALGDVASSLLDSGAAKAATTAAADGTRADAFCGNLIGPHPSQVPVFKARIRACPLSVIRCR
jgi:hypothetical protein